MINLTRVSPAIDLKLSGNRPLERWHSWIKSVHGPILDTLELADGLIRLILILADVCTEAKNLFL